MGWSYGTAAIRSRRTESGTVRPPHRRSGRSGLRAFGLAIEGLEQLRESLAAIGGLLDLQGARHHLARVGFVAALRVEDGEVGERHQARWIGLDGATVVLDRGVRRARLLGDHAELEVRARRLRIDRDRVI